MALFAIGDLHLSLGTDKPMDVFGGGWDGYMDKLRAGFSTVQPTDTTVLLGDLSWAMSMEHAREDFAWINAIPGEKIIIKGNHDYWWATAGKFYGFCAENGFSNMKILNNNCWFYGDTALCGTRGWFYEEDKQGTHDEKIFRRELGRLETSLKAAGDARKLCFLHYPPKYGAYRCDEILDLLVQYGVSACYYGHLHGESHRLARRETYRGVELRLVSADYLEFQPLLIG